MAKVKSENNTGGDKTAAAIVYYKRQIEALSKGVIDAEMKRDRAVDRGNASMAHVQAKLDKEVAKLEALEA